MLVRKSSLALLTVAVIAGLTVLGLSLVDSEAPPTDVRVDRAGVSTEITELPAESKISVYPAPGVRSAAASNL